MPLKEGQILESDTNKFVLVRANKDTSELIAIDINILSEQNSLNELETLDVNLFIPDAPEKVIDIADLTSEELSKTSQLDLDSILNEKSDQIKMSNPEMTNTDIEDIAKEMIENVISCSQKVCQTMNSVNESNFVIDISKFNAQDYFKAEKFDIEEQFKEIENEKIEVIKVKSLVQVEQSQKIVVFQPDSQILIPIEQNNLIPIQRKAPIIQRRMPKFNKRTKLIHELREFEAQLTNITIETIDSALKGRSGRKQKFTNVKLDLEVSFYNDDDKGKPKKPRQISMKCKKVSINKNSKKKIDPNLKCEESLESNGQFNNDESDIEDADLPKKGRNKSLRCNYCQKIFITGTGLNTHLKNCPKLHIKLSELIENGCAVKEEANKEHEVPETDDNDMENSDDTS